MYDFHESESPMFENGLHDAKYRFKPWSTLPYYQQCGDCCMNHELSWFTMNRWILNSIWSTDPEQFGYELSFQMVNQRVQVKHGATCCTFPCWEVLAAPFRMTMEWQESGVDYFLFKVYEPMMKLMHLTQNVESFWKTA